MSKVERKIHVSSEPIEPADFSELEAKADEVSDIGSKPKTEKSSKVKKSTKSKTTKSVSVDGAESKLKAKTTKTKSSTKSKSKVDSEDKSVDTAAVKEVKKNSSKKSTDGEAVAKKADTKKADTKKADTKKADTKKADTKKADTKKAVEMALTTPSDATEDSSSSNQDIKGIDLLVSFDTTGSMYPVLAQVRREVDKLIAELLGSINNINIGVIAHGDYCDANDPYTIRFLDFTTSPDKLHDFVVNTAPTYGGDADECYELVLNTARKHAGWHADNKKILMMIGDAEPHSPNYPMNKDRIDWKKEVESLRYMGVQIFSVHCLPRFRSSSASFYKHMANETNGVYLTLDQFNEIVPLIKATCYSQCGEQKLNEFITIIRENSQLTNGIARNINRLSGKELIKGIFDRDEYSDSTVSRTHRKSTSILSRTTDDTRVQADGLIPVTPGRFQTMEVDHDVPISDFIKYNGIIFQRGRGFYELSKSEKVQQYKEIIIENRETGEMFTGAQVREYLGLQPQIKSGGVTERLNSRHTKEYRVYVQSTSTNRKLIGGTHLLYEVELDR